MFRVKIKHLIFLTFDPLTHKFQAACAYLNISETKILFYKSDLGPLKAILWLKAFISIANIPPNYKHLTCK